MLSFLRIFSTSYFCKQRLCCSNLLWYIDLLFVSMAYICACFSIICNQYTESVLITTSSLKECYLGFSFIVFYMDMSDSLKLNSLSCILVCSHAVILHVTPAWKGMTVHSIISSLSIPVTTLLLKAFATEVVIVCFHTRYILTFLRCYLLRAAVFFQYTCNIFA